MNFKRFHESKNLCLVSQSNSITYDTFNNYTISNNTVTSTGQALLGFKCKVEPNTSYTISIKKNTSADLRIREYSSEPTDWTTDFVIQSLNTNRTTAVITTTQNTTWILVTFWVSTAGHTVYDIMLNTGSSPIPYEPYGDSWHDIPHYIHNTSTDTLTTLPADIYANDTTATVGLKGDMEQSGTPSPTTPIQPSECGERTGNLFDKDNATIYEAYINSASLWTTTGGTGSASIRIPVNSDVQYTLSISEPNTIFRIYETSNSNPEPSVGGVALSEIIRGTNINQYTFTTASDTKYLVFQASGSTVDSWFNSLMLNYGSSALPYEPYGYKIPILNNSQTTNVYLGEVETTREIKKLVLTGNENISDISGIYYNIPANNVRAWVKFSCSHCEYGGIIGGNTGISLWIKKEAFTDYPTITDFKAYLAAQYTAGTPVCVWYILAEPETAVVNEPLRKIGDYADEVSGITIPTIAGANTLSIGTTLQPSEVTVNYKGWHPVQSVHERENGAWT